MSSGSDKKLTKKGLTPSYLSEVFRRIGRTIWYSLLKFLARSKATRVVVSIFLALLAVAHVVVHLFLVVAVENHDLHGNKILIGIIIVTVLAFIILAITLYKFDINDILRRFAFKTIQNTNALIFLFREYLKSRIEEGYYRLSTRGFLIGELTMAFGYLQERMNIADKRSLVYLTGIDFFEIGKIVEEAYHDVVRIRRDYPIGKKKLEIEAEVVDRKLELRDRLIAYLNDTDCTQFDSVSVTGKDPHLRKLSGILENIILQDSYHKSLRYFLLRLIESLRLHTSKITSNKFTLEEIKDSLIIELSFWNYVSKARTGMHLFTFLNYRCEGKLDLLGGADHPKVRKVDSLQQQEYIDELNDCTRLLVDMFSTVRKYDMKFKDSILAEHWPSESDVFVVIGVGTGIQRLFETIPFDNRRTKKIFVIHPDRRTLYSEEPMRKWLESKGYVRTVAETAEHIAQDLRDGDYKKVCFIMGYAVLHEVPNDTFHRYGVVRVWRELNHITRGGIQPELIKKTVMVGHSYKTVKEHSNVVVGWAYATIRGYETDYVITEKQSIYREGSAWEVKKRN